MRNKAALESIQNIPPRNLNWQGQATPPCWARATEPGGVGSGVRENGVHVDTVLRRDGTPSPWLDNSQLAQLRLVDVASVVDEVHLTFT